MLREQLGSALKDAMRAKDARAVGTVRLILAALKDRDIAVREKGVTDGVGEDEILAMRSEEHTSELQSLMRISYAVFCLKKKKKHTLPQTVSTTATARSSTI